VAALHVWNMLLPPLHLVNDYAQVSVKTAHFLIETVVLIAFLFFRQKSWPVKQKLKVVVILAQVLFHISDVYDCVSA